MAGPPPSLIGSWRNSVAGVSPASVTSSAIATSGWTRNAAGPAPRRPSSSCTLATATTVAETSLSASRRIVSIITAHPERSSTALPVNTRVPFSSVPVRTNVIGSPTRTPSASVSSRLAVPRSMNISCSGIALWRSSALTTCAGFVPTTPITGPFAPWISSTWSVSMRSSW